MKAEIKNDIKQTDKGQTNQYVRKGSSNKVWDFFCSVKLAVVIILVLVVSCIIGTVILQEKTFDEYVARYGYGLATFFNLTVRQSHLLHHQKMEKYLSPDRFCSYPHEPCFNIDRGCCKIPIGCKGRRECVRRK